MLVIIVLALAFAVMLAVVHVVSHDVDADGEHVATCWCGQGVPR